jgi:hypothetical protein
MLISSSLHQYRTVPSYAGQCPDKNSPRRARYRSATIGRRPSPRDPGAETILALGDPGHSRSVPGAKGLTRQPLVMMLPARGPAGTASLTR